MFYTNLVRRQTVLFSATQTRNVEDLARVSLKKSPLYVGVDDHRETSTVEGLEQVQIGLETLIQRSFVFVRIQNRVRLVLELNKEAMNSYLVHL